MKGCWLFAIIGALLSLTVQAEPNRECPAAKLLPEIDSAYHEGSHGFVNGSCELFVTTFRQLIPKYDCQRAFDNSPVPAIWLANSAAVEDYLKLLSRLAAKNDRVLSGQWFSKACSMAKELFGSAEFRDVLDGSLAEDYGDLSRRVERNLKGSRNDDQFIH